MPRKELDTSHAKCRVCGKLYQNGDTVYSIANRFDENIEDRDVLIEFCHWECHTPIEKVFDNLRASADKLQEQLGKFKL